MERTGLAYIERCGDVASVGIGHGEVVDACSQCSDVEYGSGVSVRSAPSVGIGCCSSRYGSINSAGSAALASCRGDRAGGRKQRWFGDGHGGVERATEEVDDLQRVGVRTKTAQILQSGLLTDTIRPDVRVRCCSTLEGEVDGAVFSSVARDLLDPERIRQWRARALDGHRVLLRLGATVVVGDGHHVESWSKTCCGKSRSGWFGIPDHGVRSGSTGNHDGGFTISSAEAGLVRDLVHECRDGIRRLRDGDGIGSGTSARIHHVDGIGACDQASSRGPGLCRCGAPHEGVGCGTAVRRSSGSAFSSSVAQHITL